MAVNFKVDIYDGDIVARGVIMQDGKFKGSLDITVPSAPSRHWLEKYTHRKLRELAKEMRL